MVDLRYVQAALESWGALFLLLAAVIVFWGRKREKRRCYQLGFLLLLDVLLLLSDVLALLTRGNMTTFGYYAVRFSNFVVFAIMPLFVPLFSSYVYEMAKQYDVHSKNRWQFVAATLSVLHLAVVIVSPFTDFLYFFDEFNVYHRAANYPVVAIFAGLEMILLAVMTIYYRKNITQYELCSILVYLLLPFLSNGVQLFNYGLSLNNFALTASLLLLFLTHEIEKSQRLVIQEKELLEKSAVVAEQQAELSRKDAELTEKRAQISLAQLQPDFTFHALGSIEQLCKQDPKRAATAIHNFSLYLRRNLRALRSSETSRFSEEMTHTRTYVWLEKMRFGEDVEFKEEIHCPDFWLPSLTIQPLVENAINHGMVSKEEGTLHICVRAEEQDDDYVISVTDDGMGFPPDEVGDDPITYIGLVNLKERIGNMSGGRVLIHSVIAEGTVVEIRIPKGDSLNG